MIRKKLTGDFISSASCLDTRSDGTDQLGLLAMAGEVGEGRASIAGEGSDEAVEL